MTGSATPDKLPNPRQAYIARINRVMDHIDTHLADALDLNTLAAVAHFSPWHFHRVFQAMTGETLADCVRRRRLEAAAQRLLQSPPLPALQVALELGFASAEVFSRTFKAHFAMTPTAWRRGGWRDWVAQQQAALSKIHQGLHKAHQAAAAAFRDNPRHWPSGPVATKRGLTMHIEIQTLAPQRLAYLRYTGPYGSPDITQTWGRFAAWCAAHGLMEPRRTMYGLSLDNPAITAPDKCRYDCCVVVDEEFKAQGEIGVQTHPGGRYACAHFSGTATDIHAAWMHLYGDWLANSPWQADDKPNLEIYPVDFVMDPVSGAFSCLLCVPVKPL
ncbi:MAG: AraC family transcriptional regulator [Pseudomonas sp.]|uniref:AraC family transcriptional regulator n=1 Tax=Pseudomonas sp. TaxID=306 RepID=UPI0033928C0A